MIDETEKAPDQPDTTMPSPERQVELQAAYEANIANGKPPYAGAQIKTLGEVLWIFEERGWSGELVLPKGKVPANLSGSIMRSVNLSSAKLIEVDLSGSDLSDANLSNTLLAGANLENARLGNAKLYNAVLAGANMTKAYLGGAYLARADFHEANLQRAYLRGADLSSCSLTGTDLRGTYLGDVNLSGAYFHVLLDTETTLNGSVVSDKQNGNISVADTRWGDVDLTGVDWSNLKRLGDEEIVKEWQHAAVAFNAVARAYRQLATQLRNQGISEDADRFAYRAQIWQRRVMLRTWRLPQYLFSLLLDWLAGYGYHPERSFLWYLAAVFGFAFAYMHFGTYNGHPFHFDEALIFSLTSFHGRGFFPGGLSLDDPITKVAAGEAVIGLFIEISFIATFTQRFFGK